MEIIQKIVAFIDIIFSGLLVYMAIKIFIWIKNGCRREK